jgi:hypothetical protein
MKSERGQLYQVWTSALDGLGDKRHLRPPYRREKALVPIVQEAGWAPGSVSVGMEKRKSHTPTAVRTQNCPTCSELLYLLHCSRPIRDGSLPKFDIRTS